MSQQVNPGEGYRLLTLDDVRTSGDEYASRGNHSNNCWYLISSDRHGCYYNFSDMASNYYRRRVLKEVQPVASLWFDSWISTGMP